MDPDFVETFLDAAGKQFSSWTAGEGYKENEFGVAFFQIEDFAQAYEHFKRAQGLASDTPNRYTILRNLGNTCMRLGKYSEAAEAYSAASKTTTDVSRVVETRRLAAHSRHETGVAAFNAADYKKAYDVFKQALDDPDFNDGDRHVAFFNLGNASYHLALYDEAVEWYSKACSIAPHDELIAKYRSQIAKVYRELGIANFKATKYQEALDSFVQALNASRTTQFRFLDLLNLGNALQMLGQYDAAAKCYSDIMKDEQGVPEHIKESTMSELAKLTKRRQSLI